MILKTTFNEIFKDSFLKNFNTDIAISQIIITLLFALIISVFVFYMYKITCKDVIYSKKFNISMCLMSLITAAIVLSMQANITVSLGMVGALSIVRFRTAIKEPRDLLFLFWSISNGIIIGSGIYMIALILAIVLCLSMIIFDIIPEKVSPYLLVIYFKSVKRRDIEIILTKNKLKYKLKSQNLTTKECNFIYEIRIKNNMDFVEEIQRIKGITEVSLLSQNGESL